MDSQSDKQSEQYYDEFLSYIRDHLTAFYQHYADDNGLTLAQTTSRVSRWDINQWKHAIDSLGDTSGWPEEAKDRLTGQTAVASINKRFLMGSIIAIGVIHLTVRNQRAVDKRVATDGHDESNRMKKALNLSRKQVKKHTGIITQASTRKQWSESLWVDSDKLAADVQYLVNQNLKHGLSLDGLPRLLNKHANPNQFKPSQSIADRVEQMSYETKRLIRSESARMKQQVDITSYKMRGVKWVKWLTEPGACSKCQGIAAGGPYPIDEVPEIPGDSHPNCRCSIVPYVRDSGATKVDWNDQEPQLPEEEKAQRMYHEFVNRKEEPQVARIAENTGFSQDTIKQVFEHIFTGKHKFKKGPMRQFDPDYDMAQSWQRLIAKDNKNIRKSDILMLEHEMFESILMKDGLNYEKAHEETSKIYNYARAVKRRDS